MRIHKPVAIASVAIAGLIVGLAAPAAASSARHLISGSQIKPNSITGRQIKESSLATVPSAKTSKSVDGSKPVAIRVTTGATSSPFVLFKLQDAGKVTVHCDSGTPAATFVNNTGKTQALTVMTYAPSTNTEINVGGPAYGSPAGFTDELGSFVWTFDAMSSSGPVKTAHITMMTYATGSGCFWGVEGESSLAISR